MSKITTTPITLGFPSLVTPRVPTNKQGQPTGEAKYGCALIWEPDADLTAIKNAIGQAMVEKLGPEKAADMVLKIKSGRVKTPLHHDEDMRFGAGQHWYLNARNKIKPQVVDGSLKRLTDAEIAEKCYSGSQVRASITFFWYDNESMGVGAGLNHLQYVGDGPRLDGRTDATKEFDAIETPIKDLASLMG